MSRTNESQEDNKYSIILGNVGMTRNMDEGLIMLHLKARRNNLPLSNAIWLCYSFGSLMFNKKCNVIKEK